MPQVHINDILPHLLYTPDAISERKRWGLIVFLHGRGERGTNTGLVKKWGLPKKLETEINFPFMVLSPQCPETSDWEPQTEPVMTLIDKLISSHPVDTTRIYLTGFSMGGLGTWTIAMQHPQRFKAIAPVAAVKPAKLDKLAALKDMPTWVFHSENDEAVPISHSDDMVAALQEMGAEYLSYTRYETPDHCETADLTYDMKELYNWFLKWSIET